MSGQELDSCVVVWLSFFVAVLVGSFVAVLVVVLLFAFVVGCLAPGLDPCMIVLIPVS